MVKTIALLIALMLSPLKGNSHIYLRPDKNAFQEEIESIKGDNLKLKLLYKSKNKLKVAREYISELWSPPSQIHNG